jgi:hypothetical protein
MSPSSLRLKPLAICLTAALAVAPTGVLLADRLHPSLHAAPTSVWRSSVAQAIALSPGVNRKGRSLEQSIEEVAAKARANRPSPPQRPAAVLPVTSCADSGPGTLRDVVAAAASGDVVDLNALSCSSITLTTGAISTTVNDLTILGPGAAHLKISAGGASGVINHYGVGTLAVDGVTLADGYIQGYAYHGGACVLSAGNVTVDNAKVENCLAYTAHAYGGAICAVGDITLNKSTITGNTTKGHIYFYTYPGYPNPYQFDGTSRGGGAYAGGRFTITGSTISNNDATYNSRGSTGGGIASRSGGHVIASSTFNGNHAWLAGGIGILGHYAGEPDGLTVLNSTISGNSAGVSGGGMNVYRLSYLTLHNSTVTGNSSEYCGGVYVYYGTADIKSTIIAANQSSNDTNQFGYYSAADLDVFSSNATITGEHDAVMTTNAPVPAGTITADPLLQPLADNGGPTATHALPPSSVAIDAGSNPDALDYDQRGNTFARVLGAAADIGAFEAVPITDAIFTDGFD